MYFVRDDNRWYRLRCVQRAVRLCYCVIALTTVEACTRSRIQYTLLLLYSVYPVVGMMIDTPCVSRCHGGKQPQPDAHAVACVA